MHAMNIIKELFGQKHMAYAGTLMNLGNIYSTKKDYERAKVLYIEAMNISRELLGQKHGFYAGTLNNIGNLYFEMKEYEQALAFYKKALKNLVLKQMT
jgi:tetratricopeptide (TPR) repeat protein